MRTLALLAAGAALVCTASSADNARTLVLAGGHLPICSSMNLDACADDQRDQLTKQWQQAEALFEAEYDPRLLRQLPPALAALLPAERVAAITEAARSWPDRRQNRAAIEQAIARSGLQLNDDETLWLFERMDTPSRRRDEKSVRLEQLSLAATDPNVRAVFQRFVSASQRNLPRKPRIGVFTSAAREPLDAAAFYQQWFAALGADVVWIPLDAASRALRDRRQPFDSAAQRCGALIQERAHLLGLGHFARADQALWQHYCRGDDLLPLLQTLDGVFFNGGDQSLHVRALLRADGSDSAELALLRQRYNRGELAIMGTSAGTAVQSGNTEQTLPMISNGSTAHALLHPAVAQAPRYPFCEQRDDCPAAADEAQLSYRRQGGLRFFSHGIADTHFSERARQGRLLMLLADTAQNSGFGVDETTALVVMEQAGKTEFEVVGANGVWIAQTVFSNKAGKQTQIKANAHYLRAGDRASRRSKELSVTLGSCGRSAQYKLAALDGKRVTSANGVNEAALQLQMLKTAELIVSAANSNWTFSRGKQFALCPKAAGGWSYRDLQIAITVSERLP